MVQIRFLLVICLLMFMSVSCSTTKNQASTDQEKAMLKEIIDSGDYKIEANMAYPRRGSTVPLTSTYWVQVKNDSVFSNLPFYGRAYSIPYGGGNGLIFDAPIEEYNVSYNSKGRAKIKILTRTPEDRYDYNIEIYPNGSSSIDVNMQQRESIRFSGDLEK